jgi:hypothetical protein
MGTRCMKSRIRWGFSCSKFCGSPLLRGLVGSLIFDGVRFSFYSHDHPPPHVHGHYSGIIVVVDLFVDGVALSRRARNMTPRNAL